MSSEWQLEECWESHPCAYLPGRKACTNYRYINEISPDEMDALLERGWRRFGVCYFRPDCADCQACESLRIPVSSFKLSRSQRRVAARCADLQVKVSAPTVDAQRLELYDRWHQFRQNRRQWNEQPLSAQHYAAQFCAPHPCAREMAYYLKGQLVAVSLVDQTPKALSSVYFFFDPAIAKLSPGIGSILFEINYAREQRLSYVYLGYRVKECLSLAYKGQFKPYELLEGRPYLDEPASWSEVPLAGN